MIDMTLEELTEEWRLDILAQFRQYVAVAYDIVEMMSNGLEPYYWGA